VGGGAASARLLEEPRGTFELVPSALGGDEERSIAMSTSALLLESARLNDERRAGGIVVDDDVQAPVAGVTRQLPAPDLARLFEYGLTDGWSPGEIAVLAASQLSSWTREALARERFH